MPRDQYLRWTQEEELKLVELVQKHGFQWAMIYKQHYPARSESQVQNKYYMIKKYKSEMLQTT
ncbi:MAG: hypothetical protein EOM50_25035 [Erysipelotrichia bacterium]|nr:hypothetical protein [Erysipelotrichia bacterium]